MKHTKNGVFRQFAFVGFETDEQGSNAIKKLNKICIQTNRITVELCVSLGADEKPKSWSKYSADSSAYKKLNNISDVSKVKDGDDDKLVTTKTKKKSEVQALLDEHRDDPQFIEFMEVHAKGKGIWENDWALTNKDDSTEKRTDNVLIEEEKEDAEVVDDTAVEPIIEECSNIKLADQEISDQDYMKSLMQKKANTPAKVISKKPELIDLRTIKIRNIPYKTKRQDVLNYFKPLKPYSIRLPTKVQGICYVGFKKEADFKQAMLKNRGFWSKFFFFNTKANLF